MTKWATELRWAHERMKFTWPSLCRGRTNPDTRPPQSTLKMKWIELNSLINPENEQNKWTTLQFWLMIFVACYTTLQPVLSFRGSVNHTIFFCVLWPLCSCPNALVTSNMAPAPRTRQGQPCIWPCSFLNSEVQIACILQFSQPKVYKTNEIIRRAQQSMHNELNRQTDQPTATNRPTKQPTNLPTNWAAD